MLYGLKFIIRIMVVLLLSITSTNKSGFNIVFMLYCDVLGSVTLFVAVKGNLRLKCKPKKNLTCQVLNI